VMTCVCVCFSLLCYNSIFFLGTTCA
jgi:hypothetical protein